MGLITEISALIKLTLKIIFMDTNQIENLLEAIKVVCSFDISILSARRRNFFMVIKYSYLI